MSHLAALDDDGPAPVTQPPAAAMALHIRGGTGRDTVDTGEIWHLAAVVDDARELLSRVQELLTTAISEAEAEALYAPAEAARAVESLRWARNGPGGLASLDEDLEGVVMALRHTAHLYDAAEEAASPPAPPPSRWVYLKLLAPRLLLVEAAARIGIELSRLGYLPFRTGHSAVDRTAEAILMVLARGHGGQAHLPPASIALDGAVSQLGSYGQLSLPWYAAPDTFELGGRSIALADTTPAQRFAIPLVTLANSLPTLLSGGGRPPEVRTTALLPAQHLRAPSSLPDAVQAVADLRPDHGAIPGSIQVRRTDHPHGRRSWTVLVPSTQEMTLGMPNPVDNLSNLQAYAGYATDVEAGIIAALDQLGVAPGEEIALIGHSQGGLISLRLAADPLVRARFNITTVVTAGSPVGHLPVPDDVAVLSLEHLEDPIVGLDGTQNPAAPNRVTVSRSLATEGAWRPRVYAGESHDLATYVTTAELAAADPAVAGIAERLARVTGGPGDVVHATTFVIRREPRG